jgi:hypothetical protein
MSVTRSTTLETLNQVLADAVAWSGEPQAVPITPLLFSRNGFQPQADDRAAFCWELEVWLIVQPTVNCLQVNEFTIRVLSQFEGQR